ncbi:calcium-binding protein, partial [Sedimentitalea sp. HM32M-2]
MENSNSYSVKNQRSFSEPVMVTPEHFGSNVVTKYDEEFTKADSVLSSITKEIGVSTLRYPGGAVTELLFDMAAPNRSVSHVNPDETLVPMDDFFRVAGEKDMNVTMVLPTRMAFEDIAGAAMIKGTYGQRSEVSQTYLDTLLELVETTVAEARKNGIEITGFEIGNEFWASGQMTATEYGRVAGVVAVAVQDKLKALGEPDIDIILQSHSSASQMFSPKNDTTLYVGTKHGMLWPFTEDYVQKNHGGTPPADWVKVTVPGQGTAYNQVFQIAEGVNGVTGAASVIDGLVQHYYQREGFAGVDTSHEFFFSQFDRLEDALDRQVSDAPLLFHISEWNTNAKGAEQNRGLQHASMLVENFFQLVTNGIQTAHTWPLTFDTTQAITLVSKDGNETTLSGEMFKLMSESLAGLTPVLDWSQEGALDVHGFADAARTVLFVSERSGADQQDVSLTFADLSLPARYFVTGTELWDNAAGGTDPRATAAITHFDGKTVSSRALEFDIKSWGNLRLEVTRVGSTADHVVGRDGNDVIHGFGGADILNGGGGRDELHGGVGADVIRGGIGDARIYGGTQSDTIYGGAGDDQVWGGWGRDKIYRGDGEDTFHDHGQNDVQGADTVGGGNGADIRNGGGGRDELHGDAGADVIRGGIGDDRIYGGTQYDTIYGGDGDDQVWGGWGRDKIYLGDGDDTFHDHGQNDVHGADTVWGGNGADILNG